LVVAIRVISEHDLEQWDQYVIAHEQSTFCHRAGWFRVIKSSFGHTPYYLVAEQGQTICGVLPLFEVKSWIFGHSLVSVPFCVYGGALADSPELVRSLEDYAADLAKKLNVDHLEIRNIQQTREDWPVKSIHSTFIRPLFANDEDNLAAVKYKQRAVVRKCLKNDLTLEFPDQVDEFFYAYSTSVRNLGTPVFSKVYFKALRKEFGKDCELVSIKKDGELHCALMSFYHKDTVLPYYGGGLPESRQSKAMDFMYFDQMCRAGSQGYTKYDFGRSKNGTGPYNYKRHWGFEDTPLHYQYFLVKAADVPDLNPLNPKYQLMVKTWQKLPLWLSQMVGPLVSKFLG